MLTQKQFNKVWRDSSKKAILNQYYWDYTLLKKENDLLRQQLHAERFYSRFMPDNNEWILLTKDDYERLEADYMTRCQTAIEELELWQPKIEAIKIERDLLLEILKGEVEDE